MGGSAVPSSRRQSQSDASVSAEEAAFELLDVPAAVVCAQCGAPDCSGCLYDDNPPSGVIAIVPWERPGQRLPARLFNTARLATASSESFFGALPEGDTLPALRFALVAELLAVSGLALFLTPVAIAAAPWLGHALIADSALRAAALRALVSGIPGIAFAMIALHAAHGLGLDWGARRYGGTSARGRGLRFGLYSCGWDLMTLPLAVIVTTLAEGPRRALALAGLGLSVPGLAASAYVRQVHHLSDDDTRRACRFAVLIVAGLMLAAGLLIALWLWLA